MSIELELPPDPAELPGFPELTELGKHIEVLRIRRGISKQHLARFACTSRQQLWRVLTGKSELSTSLRERLAEVLQVNPAELTERAVRRAASAPAVGPAVRGRKPGGVTLTTTLQDDAPLTLERFVGAPHAIARALHQLPAGDPGRRLKRALLDTLEDLAVERGLPLQRGFFDIRRRVLAGEL